MYETPKNRRAFYGWGIPQIQSDTPHVCCAMFVVESSVMEALN